VRSFIDAPKRDAEERKALGKGPAAGQGGRRTDEENFDEKALAFRGTWQRLSIIDLNRGIKKKDWA